MLVIIKSICDTAVNSTSPNIKIPKKADTFVLKSRTEFSSSVNTSRFSNGEPSSCMYTTPNSTSRVTYFST